VDIYNSLDDTWTTATLLQACDNMAATSVGNLALFSDGTNTSTSVYFDRVDIFLLYTSECPLNDCISDSVCQDSFCASTLKPAGINCSDDGIVCNGEEVCNGFGRCVSSGAPYNTPCNNSVWCDGDDICNGNGACVSAGTPRCDASQECNDQCNEVEQNCLSDAGTLCSVGECTGWILLFLICPKS